jgi:transcriptional regulator with XRE-family HTH domain
MDYEKMSTPAIQKELGQRLQRERLNRNLSQVELAAKSGISRRTLIAAETGEGPTMDTLISILRGLGLLSRLNQLLPETEISPVQLAKLKGAQRQRASRKGTARTPAAAKLWTWKE